VKGNINMIKHPKVVKIELTQEQANELYAKKYVTISEAAKMLGNQSKQRMLQLMDKGILTRMELRTPRGSKSGRRYTLFVDTTELRAYALEQRNFYLTKASKIKLPVE
jgi:hypothetical protein